MGRRPSPFQEQRKWTCLRCTQFRDCTTCCRGHRQPSCGWRMFRRFLNHHRGRKARSCTADCVRTGNHFRESQRVALRQAIRHMRRPFPVSCWNSGSRRSNLAGPEPCRWPSHQTEHQGLSAHRRLSLRKQRSRVARKLPLMDRALHRYQPSAGLIVPGSSAFASSPGAASDVFPREDVHAETTTMSMAISVNRMVFSWVKSEQP